jgi:AcrR family transcriptional regulator
LEKLLAAAEEQLREGALDAFTVQNVLVRAGLSVGAFYSRFPDKTALLHAVQERVHGRVEPQIQADLAALTNVSQSLEEAVDRGFEVLIKHPLSERELFRAFMMLSVFDPVMWQKGEQYTMERRRALIEMLAPHREEIGHPDPDVAVNAAFAIFSGVLRGRLVFYRSRNETQVGVTDALLFGELRRALAAYLRGTGSGTGAAPTALQDKGKARS